MGISIKTQEQIELMRTSGQLLAKVHYELGRELREGITTKDIDRLGEEIIRSFGCVPNFLNYNGYPASICVSVNDEIVHGIPSDQRIIRDGDIVSLDAGLIYKGWHSDAARTHGVGQVKPVAKKLMDVTKESFFRGMKAAKPGNYLSDIAREIQSYAEGQGFSVVRDLCGHGIGTSLHEEPEIPNFVRKGHIKKGMDVKLQPGMTLAIEPMINEGEHPVWWLEDDWTVVTYDGSLSAHYENTIVITKDGYEILTMLPDEK